MSIVLRIILILLVVLILLIALAVVGLRVQPAPFPAFAQREPTLETMPLPQGLPAPVERFYRTLYGEQIPVIHSAVVTGRGQLRPAGPVYLPSRFRFTHVAGQDYRHYIELTIFGVPFFKVNERYLEGQSRMELPWATEENQPQLNQGANLGLWAEAMWFPAIYLTDPRVHWEALDDTSAVLVTPFENTQEHFVVRFDPQTGLPQWMESMRYQTSTSAAKVLWLNQVLSWDEVNGHQTMNAAAAIWMDDGKPWAIFRVEDLVYNVDVGEYVRQKGL